MHNAQHRTMILATAYTAIRIAIYGIYSMHINYVICVYVHVASTTNS